MATKRPTFEKRQRERDKQAKAAAKRERRQSSGTPTDAPEPTPANVVRDVDVPSVLARVDELHRRFEEGSIDFDDFDEQKRALLATLPVD